MCDVVASWSNGGAPRGGVVSVGFRSEGDGRGGGALLDSRGSRIGRLCRLFHAYFPRSSRSHLFPSGLPVFTNSCLHPRPGRTLSTVHLFTDRRPYNRSRHNNEQVAGNKRVTEMGSRLVATPEKRKAVEKEQRVPSLARCGKCGPAWPFLLNCRARPPPAAPPLRKPTPTNATPRPTTVPPNRLSLPL